MALKQKIKKRENLLGIPQEVPSIID